MSFVQPIFLLGTLLGAVPILIHLINRRRARRLDFSALDFLLRTDRRLARKLRLKEILLLLLRTLLVMVLPVALAQPYFPDASLGEVVSDTPRSVVVVLDRGLDMWLRDDRDPGAKATLLDRARREAQRALADLPPGSTVGVVLADAVPQPIVPHLASSTVDLSAKIRQLRGRYGISDLVGGVRAADSLLAEEGLERKDVVVVGRLTEADVLSLSRLDLGGTGLRLVPVRRATPPRNGRIASVLPESDAQGGSELRVRVENLSKQPLSTTVSLEISGQTLRQEVRIDAEGWKDVRFAWVRSSAAGGVPALATVGIEADDFAPDNRWYFLPGGSKDLDVLVVNGSPRPVPFQDEVFFLTRALDALAVAGIPLRVETVAPGGLRPAAVAGRDVIVLANVHLLPVDLVATLRSAAEAGTGILVSLGDGSDEEFARRLRDLLALPLREIHATSGRLGGDQGIGIGAVHTREGSARDLAGAGSESLRRSRVFRYGILAPAQPGDVLVRTWLTLENSAPLLVERRLGRGRLMLLATSIDLDWTDLPAHPGYLQLVGVLMRHLAGRTSTTSPAQIRPGETWSMEVGAGEEVRELRVSGPRAELRPEAELRVADGASHVRVRGVHEPGLYQVWSRTADGRELVRRFVVNVERSDRPGKLATEEEIAAVERAARARARGRGAVGPDPAESGGVPGTPIWPFILMVLVLLLASEAYAALRIGA